MYSWQDDFLLKYKSYRLDYTLNLLFGKGKYSFKQIIFPIAQPQAGSMP